MLVGFPYSTRSNDDMSDPTTLNNSHPSWWGLLIPRASPNCSLFSRVLSRAIQLPTLLIGVCLSVALLALMPAMVIGLVGIELLLGRRGPMPTGH